MAIGLTKSELGAVLSVVALIGGGVLLSDLQDARQRKNQTIEIVATSNATPIVDSPEVSAILLPVATPPIVSATAPLLQSDESGKIDLNTATAQELDRLPRIGPTRAQAIIEYRNHNGEFQSVDQLGEVAGIGEKTLELIRPYLHVNPSGVASTSADPQKSLSPLEIKPLLSTVDPAVRTELININTATAQELQNVPGVGPVLAERIIDYRKQQRFTRPEELIKVSGIGPASYAKMKHAVSVSD